MSHIVKRLLQVEAAAPGSVFGEDFSKYEHIFTGIDITLQDRTLLQAAKEYAAALNKLNSVLQCVCELEQHPLIQVGQ